jgi:hypothetical protein
MIEAFICGYNLFCHIGNLKHNLTRPKYPPDVAVLCQYFEEQKSELPTYCKWADEPTKPPRRKSDF